MGRWGSDGAGTYRKQWKYRGSAGKYERRGRNHTA